MRYSKLSILKDINNKPYISLFDIEIPIEKFEYRKVKYGFERLDELSDKYYNDGSYWWVIALFNRIVNPLHIVDKEYLLIPTNLIEVVNYVLRESV
jgi:hypothetical protein